MQLIDCFSLCHPSTVKTTDISSLVSVTLGVPCMAASMGQQGGKPGALAGNTSPVRGGRQLN